MSVEPGKWGVIYNPKAGTRKVQKRWKEIKEYMDSLFFKILNNVLIEKIFF